MVGVEAIKRFQPISLLFAYHCVSCTPRGGHELRPARSILMIDCDAGDAEVWLNSGYLGDIDDIGGGIVLDAGTDYRVEIRHPGYHSRYFELILETGQQRELQVKLAPRF